MKTKESIKASEDKRKCVPARGRQMRFLIAGVVRSADCLGELLLLFFCVAETQQGLVFFFICNSEDNMILLDMIGIYMSFERSGFIV